MTMVVQIYSQQALPRNINYMILTASKEENIKIMGKEK